MNIRLIAAVLCIAAGAAGADAKLRKLDPKLGWLPENRARLDAFLEARGRGSPRWDAAHPPVATFDWDNTMMKNDIGDLTMAWMLRHDALLQPPGRDWRGTSGALTDAARAALSAACDGAGEPGRALRTAKFKPCADEIFAIYSLGKTAAGAPAWTREVTLTTNEAYAWEARLLGGQPPARALAAARSAYHEAAVAPIGATQTVGTRADVGAWVRIYDPMKDLVGALKADGFDVWIVSASPQPLAEAVASEVGIAADHVVGVRPVVEKGRYTNDLESCGGAPQNSLVTFNRGKRCWINQAIFHRPEAEQLERAAVRQAFAAGDSDTDLTFVQDATDLKLVLDRNKVQLMCNAWANAGGRWLVQPMFLDPMPPRGEPYPCSTALDAAGAHLSDEDGRPIPDQRPR